MNIWKSKLWVLAILLFACDSLNENVVTGPNTAQFNLDLFEQNLIDYVNWGNDSPIGWAYAITQNGQLARFGGFGNAVQEPDGTTEAMTANKEINIASVTKFYTAIVVMQLLEELDLTIHSLINPYFPPSWTPGPNMDSMTFAHLLRHESGLDTGNTDFDNTLSYTGIKQSVENGVGVPPPDQADYDNINFAIFRILIPSLQNNLPNAPLANLDSDQTTQAVYRSYMQSALFDKINMSNIDFTEENNNPTRYYNISDISNGVSGTLYGDWDNKSGGGGYFMTVIEMAAVNAFFQHSDVIVSNNARTIIKENYLGLDSYFDGDSRELHGKYYGKNGSIGNSSNVNVSQGVLTQIQMFPINGIEIAVMVNTRAVTFKTGFDGFLRSSIKEAYNDAWE